MVTLDGMTLVPPGNRPTSGAALRFVGYLHVDQVIDMGDGWEVEVQSTSPWVVARGGAEMDHDKALEIAAQVAQKGLDLLSIKGQANVSISGFQDKLVVWWRDGKGVALRLTLLETLSFSSDENPLIIDDDNVARRKVARVVEEWDESFRYFRLAQTTDDLFDAFRNVYLALESIASEVFEKGKDSEKTWLTKVLKHVNLPNISSFARPGVADPVDDIVDEIYSDLRNSIFHAKRYCSPLVPHELTNRERVIDAYRRMTGLYLALVEARLGVVRLSGGVSNRAFRESMSARSESHIWVGSARDPRRLHPLAPPLPDPDSEHTYQGQFTGMDAALLGHVDFVALGSESEPSRGSNWIEELDDRLILEGISRFEARVGYRVINSLMPRTHYST